MIAHPSDEDDALVPAAQDKNFADEALIPDPVLAKDSGVTLRTIKTWEKTEPDFPARVRIRGRNYRRRGDYQRFKHRRSAQTQTQGNAGWQVTRTRPRVRGRFSTTSGV
jgi:hypothetical protein